MYEQTLARLYKEKGELWTLHHLEESIDDGQIKVDDISLRTLACHAIEDGYQFVERLNPSRRGGLAVREAANAVDSSAFSNITGQLLVSAIQDGMKLDELIGDQLVSNFPSTIQEAEKIPGISSVTDEFEKIVPAGEPYPDVGMSEEWVTIPAGEKRGGILGLTREALAADRTGVIIMRAKSIGKALAIRREKSILDVVIGGVNPYRRMDNPRVTYNDTADGFDNLATEILTDFTDLRIVTDLFYAMRDPNTGEPLGHSPTAIVCGKNLAWQARAIIRDVQVIQATRVARATPTVGTDVEQNMIGSIPFDLTVHANEWVIDRLIANTGNGGLTSGNRALANAHWIIGNFKEAFIWKENWPLTVDEEGGNSALAFSNDIILRFKASYKGRAGVREPRLVVRSGGTDAS